MNQIAVENHLYTMNDKLDVQNVHAHIDLPSALQYNSTCHMDHGKAIKAKLDIQSVHAHIDLPSARQYTRIYHMDRVKANKAEIEQQRNESRTLDMNQIEVENHLYTLNGKLKDLTASNNAAQNELRTLHEGIVTNTGKTISVAEFQEKGCEKFEKYCESLAEEMEIVSHLPNQPHPIVQKPIAELGNFIQFFSHMTTLFNSTTSTQMPSDYFMKVTLKHTQFFSHMTTIFNSPISTQMTSDYFVKVTLKHTQSLHTVKRVCEPQLDSLLYNSETCQSVCLYVCPRHFVNRPAVTQHSLRMEENLIPQNQVYNFEKISQTRVACAPQLWFCMKV